MIPSHHPAPQPWFWFWPCLILVFSWLLPHSSFAQGAPTPFLIPFQGQITDQSNQAVADNTYDLIFSLYNERVGGQPLWTERHEKVGAVKGQVNVFLGSIPGNAVPLKSLNFATEKWLGITVDTDASAQPEMVPRQLLTPAFYSLRAGDADQLQGYGWSALFPEGNPTGSIPGSRIAPGTIGNAQLTPGLATGQLRAEGVDTQLASGPLSPTLQGLGYVREAGGLTVGGTIFYAYRLDPNPVQRLTLARADGVELVDNQAAPLDFGAISTPTATIVLTVLNLGNRPITGLSASIDGAHPGDFTYSFGATSVPVGGSTSLLVTYFRNYYGQRNAAIHVNATGLSNPFDLPLRATGSAPGFALIPEGQFTMGRTSGDTDPNSATAPPITVTLSVFIMQEKETTKAEWDNVRAWAVANGYSDLAMGAGKAANHPVQSVSWFDAVKWCNARSQMENLIPCYYTDAAQTLIYKTGSANIYNAMVKWNANGYRLPTEAEWEKAARGGVSAFRYPWGTNTISHAQANYYGFGTDFGNQSTGYHPTYNDGVSPYTAPVGSFAANGFGLHDMAGNVWEWCWDLSGGSYVNGATDPRGPATDPDPFASAFRSLRGGSWSRDANQLRCSHRASSWPSGGFNDSGVGFRPVRGRP